MEQSHVLMWRIIAVIGTLFVIGMVIWLRLGGGKSADDDAEDEADANKGATARPARPSGGTVIGEPRSPRSSGPIAIGEPRSVRPTGGMRPSPDPGTPPATPFELADQAERKFRKARASEGEDLAPSAPLRALGDSVAQQWEAIEEHKRAADVYRDAYIFDKALKLYVNTLKDYPEGATVASKKGDHALAAKLHTFLGNKDQALSSWVAWGRTAPNPMLHVKEMRVFGDEHFTKVLVSIIETRPFAHKDAELFYRLGGALDDGGFPQAALRVLKRLGEKVPHYKDVVGLCAELEQRVAYEANNRTSDAEDSGLFAGGTAAGAFDSDPPHVPLELPRIEDEVEAPTAPEAAPEELQSEPLMKTALATLALVKESRKRTRVAVEETVARTGRDDR